LWSGWNFFGLFKIIRILEGWWIVGFIRFVVTKWEGI
jgi:hypothetical protein